MAKYYEIQQTNPIGNGSTTVVALVVDPEIQGMAIHATQVGVWDGNYNSFDHLGHFQHMYHPIEPVDFFIVGNATCVERRNPFSTVE